MRIRDEVERSAAGKESEDFLKMDKFYFESSTINTQNTEQKIAVTACILSRD